jgi:hypothetical protein
MRKKSYYQDVIPVLTKDYQVSKRQYAFYLLDCKRDSVLIDLCNSNAVGLMQKEVN